MTTQEASIEPRPRSSAELPLCDAEQHRTLVLPCHFELECGRVLADAEIRCTLLGKLSANQDNVVWIFHTLTSDSDPRGWWAPLVGNGKLIDPARHFIVCANVLGSCYGSTGPSSIDPATGQIYGMDFPLVTIKDMVRAHEHVRRALGIRQIRLGIGGSLGGQQAVEWAATTHDLFESLCLVAMNARQSAWGIALNEAQRMALEADSSLHLKVSGAGKDGLAAARAIAMLSYRNHVDYCDTQTDDDDRVDHFRASSYQRHQGQKLVKRFDAHSYWCLTKAMDSHNLGRGRKSVSAALRSIDARTLVVGFDSDVLFPIEEQRFVAEHLPHATLEVISTKAGHDGTLIEAPRIATAIAQYLDL